MRYSRILPALLAVFLLLCSCSDARYSGSRRELLAAGKGNIAAVTQQADAEENGTSGGSEELTGTYIVNTNTKVIHKDHGCSSVQSMSDKNKKEINPDDADTYIESGYHYCSRCSGG